MSVGDTLGMAEPQTPAAQAEANGRLEQQRGLRYYRLGRLSFALSGEGECVRYLHDEMESLRVPSSGERPRVIFDFVDALPPIAGRVTVGPVAAADGVYQVAHEGLTYQVEGTPGALRVTIVDSGERSSWKDLLPGPLRRMSDWNYLSTAETRAKNFMYAVFDHITHVAQLPIGQAYIHASGIERDGQGTALLAWGGIGKTSAMLKLVTEHGFKFLSDDLGLVDESGILWRTPKRLQVYGYNLEGDDRLRSLLLDGRSVLDRASWSLRLRLRGPKKVRRRVSAEALLGMASVARSAPLERVFYLERADVRDFDAREISASEVCRRAVPVVMHELEPFGFLSRALSSGHPTPILPDEAKVARQTHAVLMSAFRNVRALSISIPFAATPDALARYLLRLM